MANDPLDDMPKIRLDEDDLESFHRTRAQATKKSVKKSTEPDEPVASSGGPSWVAVLLLLVIICAVAGYWSFAQHKVLQQSQNRITELENRLSATGEDMGQSTAALQIKLSELSKKTEDLWEQMDKLWASAWRRNQSEIGALNKTVMTLKSSTEKSNQSLNNEMADNNTSVGLVKEQLEKQASLLNQLSKQISQVSSKDGDFEIQLASIREKLISTALANNNLTNQIEDLRRRLVTAEKKTTQLENILTGPTS